MEPATLTTAAIATLVLTKALEKTGEVIGEKGLAAVGKLLSLLRNKYRKIAEAIESAQTQPLDYGQAVLIGQQVEEAAQQDPEIAEAVEDVANTVKVPPAMIQNFTNTVNNNYGGNVGNVSIQNQNQTFNF